VQAAVPEKEQHHRNEAPSTFLLAMLFQFQKSHMHAFARLSEAAGLTLGLEEAENVILTDCGFLMLASGVSSWGFRFSVSLRTWALDVADDGAGGVVHELDADLGHATAGA
jgi:hypothetical protein